MKIRGNAQHIADKYATLARDAQAAGDRVMAENYLQHAEHYNRIILAAQAQMAPQMQREESYDDDDGDETDNSFDGESTQPAAHNGNGHQPPAMVNGSGPQPDIEGTPAEVALGDDGAAVRTNGSAPSEAASSEAGEGNGATRRPRRAPRTRRPRSADAAASNGDEGNGTKSGDGADSMAASVSGE